MDALEVGFEGVRRAGSCGALVEEGLDDSGRVIGDHSGDFFLSVVSVSRCYGTIWVNNLNFTEKECGVHRVGFFILLGEVDREAFGSFVVGADDADTPGLVKAEGGLTRCYPVNGGLQRVNFTTLWVRDLVAHCKNWFWG